MRRNILSVCSLIVVGFAFGLLVATMVAPVAMAGENPTPTCCHYDGEGQWATCNDEVLLLKPWVTVCYTASSCYCQPGIWQPNANCVCT